MSSEEKQFYQQVLAYIRQHRMLDAEECVLLGVSGGVDSVVLLHVLLLLKERLGIRLHVAHLNHQFRGDEAERDADFVRCLAGELAVECTIESMDVPAFMREANLSPQDAARQCRYRFFQTLAEKVGAEKIATAHHADDQAETVLMGLLRGVGLHGLGGIRPVLNGQLIRPLLSSSRTEIESFARLRNLSFVTDSSNLSRKYLRNAIRLDLLPFLQQQFTPAILTRLTHYAQIFQEDAFFIDKIASRRYTLICRIHNEGIDFNLALFCQEEATIQRELVCKAYEELCGGRHRLETAHVRAVVELFTRKRGEKTLSLPDAVVAERSYTHGRLERRRTHAAAPCVEREILLNVPGTTRCGSMMLETEVLEIQNAESFRVHVQARQNPCCQYFDYEKLSFPLRLRFRQPGDSFQPLGMQGKKRVKKIFIDRKVPRHTRHIIPIIVDTEGIVWVFGHSIDERVKLNIETNTILRCHIHHE
ncbi:MAG: tRNA lysidine(34) synthetase TilS [bacterium]|nr:tRNA lysidine(34) synthetase TilS [bacterium]